MGTGDNKHQYHHHHHHLNFHFHIPHFNFHHQDRDHHEHDHVDDQLRDVPKGCLAIMVGHEGEEQQKFVVPVIYINHPLFMQLLKEAEEEYGFDHTGPITLPCHVEEFRTVQGIIGRDKSVHHHHQHHVWCFRT
ncbi:hypothetical protein EZV62_024417 [Acer yangbiense]|uniref:Auxin-responsive protein SAUR32 n=1 Tax=Acer yangbiense TaxID=1000413 RepID=A0A5C7GW39_9ROSI|nr:hypothetical protein EZV62_024417 [Acer yangbiense]